MSMKRQAVTELNHENWDKEDPEEQEESGTFKTAPVDILEKRVIRTAKRRSTQPQGSTDEAKKSVFSGFGGFNKTQPSSFDFLANLTNGTKNANDKSTNNDTPASNTLFSSKPAMGSPTGIFSTTATPMKTSLGSSNTQTTSSLFSTSSNKPAQSSVFTANKADSTVKDSPFKIQPVTSTGDTNTDTSKLSNTNTTATPISQVTSNIFGISSTSGTTTIPGKSLFATNNNTSSLFKTQSTNSTAVPNTNAVVNSNNIEKKDDKNDDKKITYYTKLKGLNESVSDWIKKHVEETPLCILTPIFKDYEKYLKEMQDEYEGPVKENVTKMTNKKDESQSVAPTAKNNITPASNNNLPSTLVSKTDSPISKPSIFGNTNNSSTVGDKPAGFTFGANTSNVTSSTSSGFTFGNNTSSHVTTTASTGFSFGNNISSTVTTASSGFTFGNKTSAAVTTTASTGFTFGNNTSTGTTTTASTGFAFGNNTSTVVTSTASTGFAFGVTSTSTTTSTPFTFSPNKTTNSSGATPFSFGTGKPFSFNSSITQKVEKTEGSNDAQEEDDTPPKVEFTPITEENSVYDKRCKIFIKKDGNFVDKGVGTLYIKKIEDSNKHQLLVRANTTLGNVLLNLRISSAIPTQRMGKNNVMLVCIPTPETKPPPTPVLIRVKTGEEADELLETLNKYKS